MRRTALAVFLRLLRYFSPVSLSARKYLCNPHLSWTRVKSAFNIGLRLVAGVTFGALVYGVVYGVVGKCVQRSVLI